MKGTVPRYRQCVSTQSDQTQCLKEEGHEGNHRYKPIKSGPCLWITNAYSSFGGACPNCGHTSLLHPSPSFNPALAECLVCEIREKHL